MNIDNTTNSSEWWEYKHWILNFGYHWLFESDGCIDQLSGEINIIWSLTPTSKEEQTLWIKQETHGPHHSHEKQV